MLSRMDPETIDQPINTARANLSELLSYVRIQRRIYFLASRGKRQAAVVPVELGELVARVGGPDEAASVLSNHLGY